VSFQADSVFLAFLQTCAKDVALRVHAAGENFILDESEAWGRGDEYLKRVAAAHAAFAKTPFVYGIWAEAHKAHGEELVAAKAPGSTSVTFDTPNAPNLTLSSTLEPNTQVLRLESVNGLYYKVFTGDYDDPMQLYEDLRRCTAAQASGSARPDDFPRLQDWLDGINRERDQRPAWVTTYAAASFTLGKRAWAVRLRDALGLAHFTAVGTVQFPVVLLQYPLQRVFDAHHAGVGWAAVPTVLDDVPGTAGINHVFFPVARASSAGGMGSAVDLDAAETVTLPEFLHPRIDYRFEDFKRVALISASVDDTTVATARTRHLAKFRAYFRHVGDLR